MKTPLMALPEIRFDLRHLRYFCAVAEERSFTRAAERLHIAQPPLSQQIKQLEDELGVRLIERGQRPLRLTPAGVLLLERSKKILSSVETTASDVRRLGLGHTGKLAIGFAGSAMYTLLPEILNTFRDLHPDVELSLEEALAADIVLRLIDRGIDLGFLRPGLDEHEHISQLPLLNETMVVAVSTRHVFAKLDVVPIKDLHGQATILYPRHPKPSMTDLILSTLSQHGVELQIVQDALHMQTAIGLVATGVGITFVPASVQQQRLAGVRYIPLDPPVLVSPLVVAWRPDNASRATVADFLQVVDATIKRSQTDQTAGG